MTITKKPPKAKGVSTPASTVPLTVTEQRILQAFRNMDRECQQGLQAIADGWVRDYPRRSKPALRLVGGGVK